MRALALLGAIVAVATAVAGLLPVAAAVGPDHATLVATVGPGSEIALAHPDGRAAARIVAGRYAIVVRDRSAEHNFKLANKPDGLRVNIDSGVDFVGERTFTVELAPGEYGYACSPHFETMNGRLTVVRQAIVALRLNAPLAPRAGASLTLPGATVLLASGERVRATSLTATAAIGRRPLAAARAFSWRIPRRARGKTLVLTVRVTYRELRAQRTLRLRIR